MKNFKFLREEKGVSQQKVADAIGSNQQSVHKYENGVYEPDIQTLMLIAEYFDTSIDFLVGRTEMRHKIEPVNEYALNPDEASVVDKFRSFSPEHQKFVTKIFNAVEEIKISD